MLLSLQCAELQEALYENLPVKSIKFEVYHQFSGLSFIEEVNFWRALKTVVCCDLFIGERSEPLSDKLGGEICIATCALVCIYLL